MKHLPTAIPRLTFGLTAAILLAPAAARCQEPDYRVEPVPPDPLAGSPITDPAATGQNVETIFASLLPPRTDSPLDWEAGPEPLHWCNEPRALAPCVPPPRQRGAAAARQAPQRRSRIHRHRRGGLRRPGTARTLDDGR